MLKRAHAEGVAPALAFGIARADAVVLTEYVGRTHADGVAVTDETVFDLASLTKPLTTTLWFWHTRPLLALDTPIGEAVPVGDPRLAETPVWRLLNHSAGLPAHRPFFEGLGRSVLQSGRHAAAKRTIRRMIAQMPLEAAPGAREIYSDLGFLLLEQICEAVSGPLGDLWADLPGHGPDALHFRPLPAPSDVTGYAATETCGWRGRRIQGEVHDDNCWTMGGVGGHAGLFGTLDATLRAGQAWLRAARGDGSALKLADDVVPMSLGARWRTALGARVLGWDTPAPVGSTAGSRFGRRAFGHLGFTGTSMWIDPEADVVMVLLTNRVCPSRDNLGIRWLRPQIHDAAWRCFT